jgi:hypothetical protein
MNFEYRHLLPADFAADSRVWIYQASRQFMLSEALDLEPMLEGFVASWASHGAPVKGFATLLFGQFIILMADERATGVSGCSTDSSVRLIKEVERRFGVNMFDRLALAFVLKDKIQQVPLAQVEYAIKEGFINGDTIYFNNIVPSKEALESHWMIPLKESWLAKKYLQSV